MYTLLALEGNGFTHLEDFSFTDEAKARAEARTLTQHNRQLAKDNAAAVIARTTFIAVRTLDSIGRNTQPAELTVADVRWLAGEVVDTCDFFLVAPEWARKTIDEVCDRRNFSPAYVKHVLSAIRCILDVNRKLEAQVARDENRLAERRKF